MADIQKSDNSSFQNITKVSDKTNPRMVQLQHLQREEEKLAKKRQALYGELLREAEDVERKRGEERGLKETFVMFFRELWREVSIDDWQTKVSLAIVHGLVERAHDSSLQNMHTQTWLWKIYEAIKRGDVCEADEIESQARSLNCGLPVLDMERDPVRATGWFGVVREINEGKARLSISIPEGKNDPEAPLWESCTVPQVELPLEYTIEDAWVGWIERTYDCDGVPVTKGRFEPASYLPTREIADASYLDTLSYDTII
jgi:hypothetical protein